MANTDYTWDVINIFIGVNHIFSCEEITSYIGMHLIRDVHGR